MKKKNAFKKLETYEELPLEVKEKLMKNIKIIRLLSDIAELFSGKMGETVAKLFLTTNNNMDETKQ